jgi:hypothetical protein
MFRPPIHEMTQVQRRTFIPNMLKVFTGCGKPGWGKEEMKPVWWPDDIPWQNMIGVLVGLVKGDSRSILLQWRLHNIPSPLRPSHGGDYTRCLA